MKNEIVLVLSLFVINSCTLTYHGNERLLISGRVVDICEQPLGEIPVSVRAINTNDDDLIGEGATDNEGYYNITTVSPKNATTIAISINRPSSNNRNLSYNNVLYEKVEDLDEGNNLYEIPTAVLKTLKGAQFSVTRENNVSDTIAMKLYFLNTISSFYDENENYLEEVIQDTFLYPDEENKAFSIPIQKDGKIRLEYQIINNGVLEEGTTEILVNQSDAYEYTF